MGGKGREEEGEEKEERRKEGNGDWEGGGRKGKGEGCVMALGGWMPLGGAQFRLTFTTDGLVDFRENCMKANKDTRVL